jgi:hypothetical protein
MYGKLQFAGNQITYTNTAFDAPYLEFEILFCTFNPILYRRLFLFCLCPSRQIIGQQLTILYGREILYLYFPSSWVALCRETPVYNESIVQPTDGR